MEMYGELKNIEQEAVMTPLA